MKRFLTAHLHGFYLDQALEAHQELRSRSDEYVDQSSLQEYQLALTAARIVYQSRQLLAFDITEQHQEATLREEHMAENLREYYLTVAGDSGIVLWGHNTHVARAPVRRARELPTIGSLLRNKRNIDYVAVGFDFDSGEFTARSTNDMTTIDVFSLESAPEGSYARTFVQLQYPAFILNLIDVDQNTIAGEWLEKPRLTWSVGCCFEPGNETLQVIEVSIAESFDVLIFVKEVSAVELIEQAD